MTVTLFAAVALGLTAGASWLSEAHALDREDAITLQAGDHNLQAAVIDPAGAFAYFGTSTAPGRVVKIDLTTFERVDAIALSPGEDFLMSAVMDPAGAFAYFGTQSSPSRVVKIDLATFERVDSIALPFFENQLSTAVIDPDGEFAYFGTRGLLPSRVVKIDLDEFERVGAVVFEPGEDRLESAVIDPEGEFAYFGTSTAPGQVVKVDLDEFERVGAITLEESEDRLFSAVIDPDGDFAYFGTQTGRIVQVNVDPPNFERVEAINPSAGTLNSAVMDPDGEFAYFGNLTIPSRVVKVDLADFTHMATTPPFASDENFLLSAVIDPEGDFAYFGTQASPGRVVKVDLETFERVDAITLQMGDDDPVSAVIDPDGEFAYFGTSTVPGRVVKVDLETFEQVGDITLEEGEDRLVSAVIDPDGDFAYFGTQTSPGRVVKVNLADFEREDALTLDPGETTLTSAVMDPDGSFAYFGTATSPGRVVKIDLADFERKDALTLDPDENSLHSAVVDPDGDFAYFGTSTAPGRVVKVDLETFERVGAITLDMGENTLTSAVIDPDGDFAYFGTQTFPGRVVKVRLSPLQREDAIALSAGNNQLSSAVVDPDGEFVYFGARAFPGRIAKVRLSTFEEADSLALQSGENSVASAVIDPQGDLVYLATATSPGRVVKVRVALTLVVNSTGDDENLLAGDGECDTGNLVNGEPECTLRAAIEETNATSNVERRIKFGIDGAGPHTIQPLDALPTITEPVRIDGTSQPGFVDAPVIELDGSIAEEGTTHGLHITAGNSTVRGLVINGFEGHGILIETEGGNTIEGNHVGTNVAGTDAAANAMTGIRISDSPGNTIGGGDPGAGNLISGNTLSGVQISGATSTENVLQGNGIGTNVAGTDDLPNDDGVELLGGASDNLIGGDRTAGEGNVISGNARGVVITGASTTDNALEGNLIGTDAAGDEALPNTGPGVLIIGARDNVIGGSSSGGGNVISGNDGSGVVITLAAAIRNEVQGNLIGTNVEATVAVPNEGHGVAIVGDASENLLGGETSEAGNVIAGNDDRGVFISGANTTENRILGNLIGTNLAGAPNLGNASDGMRIESGNNTIGASDAGNIVSGNGGDGILLTGINASSNEILANRIGTNPTGSGSVANQSDGVRIAVGASDNVIGGTGAGEGNVISGNTGDGIRISGASTTGNQVRGNLIGTDAAGTAPLGNADGVRLANARNTTIGGPQVGAGNVIAGNNGPGVRVFGFSATENEVLGNWIGTDELGATNLANGDSGVVIQNASLTEIRGNVISGNDERGVFIDGGSGENVLEGNFIGTNGAGVLDLGNGFQGVLILDSPDNRVGGAAADAGNVISGNTASGVDIQGEDATANWVQGNVIGTNAEGDAAIPNGIHGVFVGGNPPASNTLIGGVAEGAGNVISGNAVDGVQINMATENDIQGNFIGTNAAGEEELGNGSRGVTVENAADNVIGGPDEGAGNLISGNTGDGIRIQGADAVDNLVQGNYIGTNAEGTEAIPNDDGMDVRGGASDNQILDNLVSGNADEGIQLQDPGTTGNLVQGNFIGTDVTGTEVLGNASDGVELENGASSNQILGNLISGNVGEGIQLEGTGTTGNVVQGNLIGTDVTGTEPLGNASDGVRIEDGASDNLIGDTDPVDPAGNVIAFNGGDGVRVTDDSVGNTIAGNSIFANDGLGIDLGADGVTPNDALDADTGPNNLQNFPVLNTAFTNGAIGGALHSAPSTMFRVEFFANTECDPSDHGEGERFLGSTEVATNVNGDVAFSATVVAPEMGEQVTATATRLDSGDPTDTSEFSGCITVTAPPASPGAPTAPVPVTVSTGDEATEDEPLVVTVTSPQGGPVEVEVVDTESAPPAGWVFADVKALIEAPDTTPEDPIVIEFRLHASQLQEGQDHTDVEVLRDGEFVPDCADPDGGVADPDPCVQSRETVGDEIVIVVLTSQASTWHLALPEVDTDPDPETELCPPAAFPDVDPDSVHADAIACAAFHDIAHGFADGTYGPALPVRRDQMASFIVRTLEAGGYALPAASHGFIDLGGNVHADAVGRLAAAGIVRGTTATTYSPEQPVRRDQMASFLVRALEWALGTDLSATEGPHFNDTAGNVHEAAIDVGFEWGLTGGTAPGTYSPALDVRRDQMATFLIRLLERIA